MASVTARFNVSAPRPYTTRDGEERKQWVNVGRAVQWDNGGISVELHSIPVGNWFDGKLSLFPADEEKKSSPKKPVAPTPNHDDIDSDIPF